MRKIWYLLKCPEGDETDYAKGCPGLMASGEMREIVCFQYQRMMRYGGQWHLERRTALPGCVFLDGTDVRMLRRGRQGKKAAGRDLSLAPCEAPYLKDLCRDGRLIEMSRGVIRNGAPVVTSGPLKGRERLIRRIDRHKRTAQIEIPLAGENRRITVGLEIYEKDGLAGLEIEGGGDSGLERHHRKL